MSYYDEYISEGECQYFSGDKLTVRLNEMIQNTNKWLIILSPYVRLPLKTKGYFEKLLSRNVEIILIYKTNNDKSSYQNIKAEDYEWLIKHKIQVKSCECLHAKCYINECGILVASINLIDYSMSNNFEQGIYIKKVANYEEQEIYEDILHDILDLNLDSELDFDYDKYNSGYCIRTGKRIEFNINKPMCDEAWDEWCKTRDPDIEEKYCHYSGKESGGKTSIRRPILRDYFYYACDEHNTSIDKKEWWSDKNDWRRNK